MILKDVPVPEQKVTKRNSFIRLSLRKPKEWKVALTTSVSSPAIIPPEIQLWDEERGDVLLDTSQNCVRSKSASFTGKSESSYNSRTHSRTSGEEESYLSPKQIYNVNVCPSKYFVNGSQNRSKSLSARERNEGLVKPGEYERPPTPVMVARKISLPKDSSAQSMEKSAPQINGIITHHRKQNSDSSSVGSRRKVKHNVSFGRVDTIDDSSSISSSFSLTKSKRTLRGNSVPSPRCSSSPRIVITEAVGTSEDYEATKDRNGSGKVKHRSRSGIPVSVGNREIPANFETKSRNQAGQKDQRSNISSENVKPGRKSRMELFMSQQIGKHKFTVTRVPESSAPSLTQKPLQEKPLRHHCDRGNCPFDKYLDNTVSQGKGSLRNGDPPKSCEESPYGRKHAVKSINGNTLLKDNICRRDGQPRDSSKKREGSKQRKKRVASRSRQQMMSSSSSESDEWKTPRTPPRRRRWSRTPKGKLAWI